MLNVLRLHEIFFICFRFFFLFKASASLKNAKYYSFNLCKTLFQTAIGVCSPSFKSRAYWGFTQEALPGGGIVRKVHGLRVQHAGNFPAFFIEARFMQSESSHVKS